MLRFLSEIGRGTSCWTTWQRVPGRLYGVEVHGERSGGRRHGFDSPLCARHGEECPALPLRLSEGACFDVFIREFALTKTHISIGVPIL